MAEWTKVGNKYEYRADLLCGVVAPAPQGEFSWYITGDDLGKASRHEVVERAADLPTAMRDAEAYLRDRLGARFRSTLQFGDRNT